MTTLLLAFLLPFGTPACSGPHREFAGREFFELCHDSSRKTAVWVGYELTPAHLARTATRPSRFYRDTRLAGPSASDADYLRSGFTRGHMAPAADFAFSSQAIRRTFLLSNAVPQHRRVNSGRWAQLENAVRKVAAQADSVVVFTGTLYESVRTEFIGQGKVAVPSHTFKVVLVFTGTRKIMFAAIIPNTSQPTAPLAAYMTTVDEVERRSGLDFFSGLPDGEERQLESQIFKTLSSFSATRNSENGRSRGTPAVFLESGGSHARYRPDH